MHRIKMFDLLKFQENTAIISDNGDKLTYQDMNGLVEQLYTSFQQRGLVFCLCENAVPSIVGYIMCVNKNIPAVLLDASKDKELVLALIEAYKPEYLWLPISRIEEFEGTRLAKIYNYTLLKLTYPYPPTETDLNPQLAICLTTSGSTGSPKLVRLSKKNLIANAEAIADYLSIDQTERPITTLPMYYSYGLSVINSHLIKGATILLTDKSVMQKEFWSFFKELNATSIAGVPYTYEMLRRLRFFRMNLPSLRTMTQAGGKLNKEIAKEYIEFGIEHGRKFIVMYGQTEATARMSYLPWDMAQKKYASIGIPIPNGELNIIDVEGNEVTEPYKDGELIYQGENVSLGYAQSRKDLALGDENNGILRTGDIAHKDEDGFFYITGRMKRFVKIWGNRCSLDAVEQLIKTITSNCACSGVDDRITVFITEDNMDSKIKTLLSEKTGFHPSAFTIKRIKDIPKTSSGKTDYHKLQELL